MAMTIHVDIVSAEQEIFSGLAEMVFAPAEQGEVGITPRHAPLITSLRSGEVRVRIRDDHEELFFVSGGILEVQPHVVTVLSDTALRANDLDEAAALKSKQHAEQVMKDKKSNIDYAKAQVEFVAAMQQLRTIEKLRKMRK